MALSIVATLHSYGTINEDHLALNFCKQYAAEPRRGYGPAMHTLLPQLRQAKNRQKAARQLFGGQGSFGNGSAMRVAPLGAFFADDLDALVDQARRSALVTHAHPEAAAGAVAIAVAAALAWRSRGSGPPKAHEFLDHVLPLIPASEVATRVRVARDLAASSAPLWTVVDAVGNGSEVTAQDTVPFVLLSSCPLVLWSAAQHLNNYEEALWQTVSAFGDMDTTCAMVGGIVSLYTGTEGIPAEWRRNREPLPSWMDRDLTSQ